MLEQIIQDASSGMPHTRNKGSGTKKQKQKTIIHRAIRNICNKGYVKQTKYIICMDISVLPTI